MKENKKALDAFAEKVGNLFTEQYKIDLNRVPIIEIARELQREHKKLFDQIGYKAKQKNN